LLNPELEQSRRTELLQELRVDYNTVHTDFSQLTKTTEKLQADNSDLIVSNSKLFRQVGVTISGKPPEEEKKEFSETISIEELEKRG
jgi:hypothetical protein